MPYILLTPYVASFLLFLLITGPFAGVVAVVVLVPFFGVFLSGWLLLELHRSLDGTAWQRRHVLHFFSAFALMSVFLIFGVFANEKKIEPAKALFWSGYFLMIFPIGYLVFRCRRPEWKGIEPEAPKEDELTPPVEEQYVDWILNHKPSLPDAAKAEYLKAAQEIVACYEADRLTPTEDQLILARRERQTFLNIGQVKYKLYEEYKTLVENLPKPDGFPPFPLLPVTSKMLKALNQLYENLVPILPWSYKAKAIGRILPEKEYESKRKEVDRFLEKQRKTKDDFEYSLLGSRIDEILKTLAASDKAKQLENQKRHFLHHTPFANFIDELPQIRDGEVRFESTFILAPPRSGKSTLLNYLIDNDLGYLSRNVSIIAMDHNGDFLESWLKHPHFHPDNGRFLDRLVIIKPSTVNPIALNPFEYGRRRIKNATGDDRAELTTQAIELLTDVFSAVKEGSAFSKRQSLVFGHCVRLCMAIPNSSLQTLYDIMKTASVEPYQEYVATLAKGSQDFFQDTFPKLKKVLDEELLWRVQAVVQNETFAPMVNAPDCKLDFHSLLEKGSFILIHCDRTLLGKEGTAVFGRLMMALVRLAMKARDKTQIQARKPVYFYIDEMQEFFDNDPQVNSMINDVRKSRLALTFATQRLKNITDDTVKDALLSCGILLVRPTNEDAITVGRYMNLDPDLLRGLPKQTFKISARDVTSPVNAPIPYFVIDERQGLTSEEQRRTREIVAAKYTYKPDEKTLPPPPDEPDDDDDDEIRPSGKL